MKSSLPREKSVKAPKVDIIIVENDDSMFDREKSDLKIFSPHIDKIYRCSYHQDVYNFDHLYDCRLIIANNPDNIGLSFFKSFYLSTEIKNHKIYGLLYSDLQENDIQFIRESIFLYERSNYLFVGFVYKRYGILEKILEVVQNIVLNQQFYPMIDCLHRDKSRVLFEFTKLPLYREIYNLKHNIIIHFQPFIFTLQQFHEDKNVQNLEENLINYSDYFNNFQFHCKSIKKYVRELLKYEFRNTKLGDIKIKTETSYYVKQLLKFIDIIMGKKDYLELNNLFLNKSFNKQEVSLNFMDKSNNGSVELFLKDYNIFISSLNKIVNFLDEFYFAK